MDYKSFLSDKISMPKYYDAETNGLGSINDDYANTVNEISNSYSGSTYSNPEKLTLEEIAAKKEARLAKKRDELVEDDSNFMLKAKSAYNYVNDLWDGKDFKANYMGKEHGMSNKIFEDVDATMEESQVKRQELIDQYNMAEDDQNARHKVYQLRLKEGYDQNGNPIYSYKTGIAETSAAERYKKSIHKRWI